MALSPVTTPDYVFYNNHRLWFYENLGFELYDDHKLLILGKP